MITNILINYLKIVDCADDDEDMRIRLAILVTQNGKDVTVFDKTYDKVHVEEEGKIGNDSRCKFFAGEHLPNLVNVTHLRIIVDLKSLDTTDGFQWGGEHIHSKQVSGLKVGENHFKENKSFSSNENSEGEYEIDYSIVLA